ncbi:MAG: class I SAM-dependent methyltransferase [Planctomycetota bacterium]
MTGSWGRDWDRFWQVRGEPQTAYGRFASFYRRSVIARAVAHDLDRLFPRQGVFCEAGCGIAETSLRIPLRRRRFVLIDISREALRRRAWNRPAVQANIIALPLRSASMDGIWNVGVLEHFFPDETVRMMAECARVLKPSGRAIFYWPPWWAPYQLLLTTIEKTVAVSWKRFRFYPDEVNRFHTRRRLERLLRQTPMTLVEMRFDHTDLFSFVRIVVKVQ